MMEHEKSTLENKVKIANLIKRYGNNFDPNKRARIFGYNSKAKAYVLAEENCSCDECRKDCQEVGFLICEYGYGLQEEGKVLCLGCKKHYNAKGKITEIFTFVIGKKEEIGEIIIPHRPILMGSKSVTVWDTEEIQSEGEIDKTKYAGRESWIGCKIGKEPKKIDSKEIRLLE